jgi:hypothetical protein
MEYWFSSKSTEISLERENFYFLINDVAFVGFGWEVIIGELDLIGCTEPGECSSGKIVVLAPGNKGRKKLFASGEIENVVISVRSNEIHSGFSVA